VLQQPLTALLADALPPPHQVRRIAGQFVAEAALAAEQSIGEASFTNS
jgi:hypothetical protein